jgi:hypothetical protein
VLKGQFSCFLQYLLSVYIPDLLVLFCQKRLEKVSHNYSTVSNQRFLDFFHHMENHRNKTTAEKATNSFNLAFHEELFDDSDAAQSFQQYLIVVFASPSTLCHVFCFGTKSIASYILQTSYYDVFSLYFTFVSVSYGDFGAHFVPFSVNSLKHFFLRCFKAMLLRCIFSQTTP